jgi:DNA-binding MurR/RpiR family transcriptional regulator
MNKTQVISELAMGLTFRTVAERHGVSPMTVWRIAKEHGMTGRRARQTVRDGTPLRKTILEDPMALEVPEVLALLEVALRQYATAEERRQMHAEATEANRHLLEHLVDTWRRYSLITASDATLDSWMQEPL